MAERGAGARTFQSAATWGRRPAPEHSGAAAGSGGGCGLESPRSDRLRLSVRLIFNRDDEVLHDVVFALGGVLAHVKAEDASGIRFGGVFDLAQSHFLADKLLEFARVDFAETFEARDLAALAQFLHRLVAFGLGVAIDGLLFVA